MVTTTKLPVINLGEFELWKIEIEQYFPNDLDYALFGEFSKEDEFNGRGTLLMALPNEHQLKFNTYKCAKTLMEAIEKRFGGNKESKKTQKTLLKNSMEFNGKLRRLETNLWIKLQSLLGHFARECRAPRENRNREPVRRNVTVETTETKALVAQDGLGYDWSDQAEEGPTNFALMAYTSSSSSSSDSEVSTCSKACLKSYETLKEHYDNLTKDFNKSQLNVGAYKAGLESVEARLDVYKKNEVVFEEDIKILKLDIKLRDNALTELRKKFKKAKKERDDLKLTLEKFGNSSKNLSKLLEIQVSDKFKTGVGFDSQVVDSHVFDGQENERYKTSEGYHAVPPPYTGNFMPLLVSDNKGNEANVVKASACWGNPHLELQVEGVIDSRCSRHMTGNMSYLSDYEEVDGGFVAFGGDPKGGRITGKGKISTDTECVVLSPNFKLLNENHVLLRVPRNYNLYSVDLKNIVPSGDALTISMNYKPVVIGNQTNGNASIKENIDIGQARKKIVPDQEYILLPLLTSDLSLSKSSKDSPDTRFNPSGEEEKIDSEHQENEDSELPNTQEPRVNQEQDANVNSTNNINTVNPTVSAADIENNVVDENIVYGCIDDPNMPNLEEIVYSDDDEEVGAEADMNNLATNVPVSPIPTTRVHKDHHLKKSLEIYIQYLKPEG
ncbi:hypothetical protein Tco_0791999 [Tanacetum coccineum]